MRKTISREDALVTLAEVLVKLGTADIDELRVDGFEGSTDAEVVRDWTNYRYGAATNQLLAELVELVTDDRVIVDGTPELLHPCPCCGLRTLDHPDDYNICRWCDWEDDGIDDLSRSSSVNGGESIADYRARLAEQERAEPFGRWVRVFSIGGSTATD